MKKDGNNGVKHYNQQYANRNVYCRATLVLCFALSFYLPNPANATINITEIVADGYCGGSCISAPWVDMDIDLTPDRQQQITLMRPGQVSVAVHLLTVPGLRRHGNTTIATSSTVPAGTYTVGELIDQGYLAPSIAVTNRRLTGNLYVYIGDPIAVGYCITADQTGLGCRSEPFADLWYGTYKVGPNSCTFGPGVDIDLGEVQATNGPGESKIIHRVTRVRCRTISTVRIYVAGGGTVPTNVPGLNAEIYINDQLGEFTGRYDYERDLRIGAKVVWADGSALKGGAITAQGIIVTEVM